jgi:nitrite reductase/ring-hydroxylating ferredoxin subunit
MARGSSVERLVDAKIGAVSSSIEPSEQHGVIADLGPRSALYPGMRRVVTVGRTSVLVHIEDDGIFAIENTCPHYQVELSPGLRRHGYVECPWHHWLINVRTGECLHNPRIAARTFRVEIINDHVIIVGDPSLDRPLAGPAHLR